MYTVGKIVVYSRGWVRCAPSRAKLKVINFMLKYSISDSFRRNNGEENTRLPVNYDVYLLEGNIRNIMLLLLN